MKIIKLMSIAFHKPYDLTLDDNRALERERRIALTSVTAIIQKLITTAIPLISIKITYDYLGVEVYGLWNAVTTFFALFAFSDLGLGNGLQTKLSQASGHDDILLAKELISSTFAILIGMSLLLLALFFISAPFVDWASLMNATNEETVKLAAPIVFVIVIPRILLIPTSIISRTQYALQEGYFSNIWEIVSSILTLIFIVLASALGIGKVALLLGTALIPFVTSLLNFAIYFEIQRKELRIQLRYANKTTSFNLLSLGGAFCILSILTTIGLSMDTFIVAKKICLEEAASYSIIYKLSIVLSAVLGVFAQPLWGANGEAITRGDVEWVIKNTRQMSYIMTALTVVVSILIVLSSSFLFKIWLGTDFSFSMSCLIWMCLMQVVQAFISPYFMILNAQGIVVKQIILFSVYTPTSFILKYVLSDYYGVVSVPMVGCLLYFFVIVIGTYNFSMKSLKNN